MNETIQFPPASSTRYSTKKEVSQIHCRQYLLSRHAAHHNNYIIICINNTKSRFFWRSSSLVFVCYDIALHYSSRSFALQPHFRYQSVIQLKTKSRFLEKFALRVMTLDSIAIITFIQSFGAEQIQAHPYHPIYIYIYISMLSRHRDSHQIPIAQMMIWAYRDSIIDMCSCSYSPLKIKIDRTKCTIYYYQVFFFANIWK